MKKILTIVIVFLTMFGIAPVNALDACYQCNSSSNVYKWSSNSDADSTCQSGYHQTSLTNDECADKGATVKYCYMCGSSNGVYYKWQTSNPNNNRCTKVDKTESECNGDYHWSNPSSSIKTVECAGFSNVPAALPKFIHNIINIIKIATPIILIIMGMIDLLKSVTASDDKAMNDGKNRLIKRTISGVIVFLVISIVQFIFGAIGTDDTRSVVTCINCFINGDCNASSNTNTNTKFSCSDLTQDKCWGIDSNGDVCAWSDGKCIRAKDKPDTSGCRAYKTEESCPYVHVNVRCEWSEEESWCTYAGKAQNCSDYKTTGACDGKNDDFGNVCSWSNGKCSTNNKSNCSDYDSKDSCPAYTSDGKICNWTNDKCTEITTSACSNYKTKGSCPNKVDSILCDWDDKISACIQTGTAGNCSKWNSIEDCETFTDDFGNACYWDMGCKNA